MDTQFDLNSIYNTRQRESMAAVEVKQAKGVVEMLTADEVKTCDPGGIAHEGGRRAF